MAIFSTIFVAPVTLYLYAVHPAWSWMYLVDPKEIAGLAALPMTIGQSVAVLLGWYVGAVLLRREKQRVLGVAAGVGGFASFVILLLGSPRLSAYGSFEDYAGGQSLGLMEVKLGYVLVAIGLGLVAASAYLVFELLRDSRRVRAKN